MSKPLPRRTLLRNSLLLGAGITLRPLALLGQEPEESEVPDLPDYQRIVAANRILAREGVVDAFGHVSIRDPRNPERFVMARSRSPALVELDDLMVFALDGTPLAPRGRTPYGERMIHGAIYAARPDVHSVIHHHAAEVLPFTLTGTPLRPVLHTAAIIGAELPLWDGRDTFGDTDLLVRSIEQGRSLAAALGDNTCILMRGHGAVVTGPAVREAVLTAVYLQVNAGVLLQAQGLGGNIETLSAGEVAAATATQFSPLSLDRAWEYFCQRAGVTPV